MTATSQTDTQHVVKFFFDQELARVPVEGALSYLQQHDHFKVFVAFVHPATGYFTEGYATFYPNPQRSYVAIGVSGWCFMAEYEGILIRLPADMNWWCRRGDTAKGRKLMQSVTYLHRGEIKSAEVEVDVGEIRIPGTSDQHAMCASCSGQEIRSKVVGC